MHLMRKLRSLAERLADQARRFTAVLSWLVMDSIRCAPHEWRRLLVATFLTLGSNALVLTVVFIYVRMLEGDFVLDLFGLHLAARQSALLLGVFLLTLLTALVSFSVGDYLARVAALRLFRRYHEEGTKRALRLLERLPDARAGKAAALIAEHGAKRIISDYSRLGGWTLRFLGNAVPAAVTFLVAFAGLILLDPMTTLVVGVLGLLVIAAQYPSNLFAATASNQADELRPVFREGIGNLVEAAGKTPTPPPNAALNARIDHFFEDEPISRYMDADLNRFRAMDLSALWMQTGGGLVLVVVLLLIGRQLLNNGGDWATLIVYATLLRLILGNTTSLFRAITAFSRFLPYIQHSRAFVLAATPALAPRQAPVPAPPRVRVNARFLVTPDAASPSSAGDDSRLTLTAGQPTAVMSNRPPGRDLAIALQNAIALPTARKPDVELIRMPRHPGEDDSGSERLDEPVVVSPMKRASVILVAHTDFAENAREQIEHRLAAFADCHLLVVYPLGSHDIPIAGERCLLVRNKADQFYWSDIPEAGFDTSARRILKQHVSVVQQGGNIAPTQDDDDMD